MSSLEGHQILCNPPRGNISSIPLFWGNSTSRSKSTVFYDSVKSRTTISRTQIQCCTTKSEVQTLGTERRGVTLHYIPPFFLRAWHSHLQHITSCFPTNPRMRQVNPIPIASTMSCHPQPLSPLNPQCHATLSHYASTCVPANPSDTKCSDSVKSQTHDLSHTSPVFYQ